MRRVADVPPTEDVVREAADGNRSPAAAEFLEKRHCLSYFGSSRPAVRRSGPGIRRHDVPEEDVVLDAELGDHTVDDRGRRFRRPLAGQLPLGREGQPADPSAAISGRLTHEKVSGVGPALEVGGKPFTAELRVRVLVERLADARLGERVDEAPHPAIPIARGARP